MKFDKTYRGYNLKYKKLIRQPRKGWYIYRGTELLAAGFATISDAERWIDHRFVEQPVLQRVPWK